MLKEVRQHYGIDQGLLADYLCISRSHLSMAESGKRYVSILATKSLLKLSLAIAQQPNENDEKLEKESTDQQANLRKIIARRKKLNEYKLPLLEQKLIAMQADQARSIQILGNIKSLMEDATPNEICLLTIIELNTRKLQRKTGVTAQFKLQIQLLNIRQRWFILRSHTLTFFRNRSFKMHYGK